MPKKRSDSRSVNRIEVCSSRRPTTNPVRSVNRTLMWVGLTMLLPTIAFDGRSSGVNTGSTPLPSIHASADASASFRQSLQLRRMQLRRMQLVHSSRVFFGHPVDPSLQFLYQHEATFSCLESDQLACCYRSIYCAAGLAGHQGGCFRADCQGGGRGGDVLTHFSVLVAGCQI